MLETYSEQFLTALQTAGVLVLWMHCFWYLRISDNYNYLCRMIIEVIKEMKTFGPSVVAITHTLFRNQWQQPLLLWLAVASFLAATAALIIALTGGVLFSGIGGGQYYCFGLR